VTAARVPGDWKGRVEASDIDAPLPAEVEESFYGPTHEHASGCEVAVDDGSSERCKLCAEPATERCSECDAGVCFEHSSVVACVVFCDECRREGRADDVGGQ
jgi:hypothetical protein